MKNAGVSVRNQSYVGHEYLSLGVILNKTTGSSMTDDDNDGLGLDGR